jgi:hypothetical protein
MEKNKNGIPIIHDAVNLERLLMERLDRERQEGFCQDNELILQQRAQDRAIGKLGFSGRA